jgi:DNA mismatch repair protein MutH
MEFSSEFELLEFAKGLIGKRFKDLDLFDVLMNPEIRKRKGILGELVETGYFGYENNTRSEADFKDLGIELKVSGFIKRKKGNIVAKERLVLSKINYNQIIKETFEFSKFIFKNRKLLIVWYEYDKNKHISEMTIHKVQLYDMTADLKYIEQDFNLIKNKVISGQAHLISDGDTQYLGACTKAATGNDTTKQPNSTIPAKPRAYSLKQSYLTGVLNYSSNKVQVEVSPESYLNDKIKQFIGLSQIEILEKLGVQFNKVPKNISKMIIDRIVGKEEELSKIKPFDKMNFLLKSSPINEKNELIERLSFHNLKLSDFEEEWEDSYWKNYFEEQVIYLFLFKGSSKLKNGHRRLTGIKTLKFTSDEIENFGKTFNLLKSAILSKDISKLPVPKSFEQQYLVLAPKGIKGDNAYFNFFKSNKTKACLMVEKSLINKKIKF